MRPALLAVATATVFAGVALAGPAGAAPVPRAGAGCWATEDGGALENSQTYGPRGEVLLCVKTASESQWQPLDGVQRPVDTWYTYGPPQTLAATYILPADSWVSASGTPSEVCTAVQTPAGGGPPVTHTNDTGYYRDFAVIPDLATMTLSGNCNWRKAWDRAPG